MEYIWVKCIRRQMIGLLLLSIAELTSTRHASVILTFMCLPAFMFVIILLACFVKCIKMYITKAIRRSKAISVFLHDIRVARILSGVHFFPYKSWRPFFIQAPNLLNTAKNVLKLTLAPPGVHLVCWGCTYEFSLWITPKKFSPPWGWCRCTHCTRWLRLCCTRVYVEVEYGLTY